MTSDESKVLIFGEGPGDMSKLDAIYNKKYTQLQSQIKNAPSEGLKESWERSLLELEEAYEKLKSLPGVEPSVIKGDVESIEKEDVVASLKSNSKTPFSKAILNPWVFFITLISLVGAIVMSTLYFDVRGELSEKQDYNQMKSILTNKELRLKNEKDHTINIINYYAVYRDEGGHIQNFRHTFDEPLEVKSGRTTELLDIKTGTKVIFPGEALFFYFRYYGDDGTKDLMTWADYVGNYTTDKAILIQ